LKVGEIAFRIQDYAPLPFLVVALIFANPYPDLMVFGGLLIAFGLLLRIGSIGFISEFKQSDLRLPARLVTNGPFAYLRFPVHMANLFILTGSSIFSGAWLPYLLYIVIFFFSILYALSARFEESRLKEKFGIDYETYLELVPRFIPRISSYAEKTNEKFHLGWAISHDKITILVIISFIIYIYLISNI
jgi:protein-S-isoprenylcysteine O-methyltransferase Ste14